MAMHSWTFQRSGGTDQVVFERSEDLANLGQLDQQLWTALACPVEGLEIDAETLRQIDTNGDGRVRAAELIAAVAWMRPRLASFAPCFEPGDRLTTAQLNAATEEGRAASAAAADVRGVLGLPAEAAVGLDEVSCARARIHASERNGDGLVPPSACHDEGASAVVAWVLAAGHGADDLTGVRGVGAAHLDAAMAQGRARLAWLAARPALPLDEPRMRAAHAAIAAVAAKVDDFFARCALAAYDQGLAVALDGGIDGDERARLARELVDADGASVERLPLARTAPAARLRPGPGVHPAWQARIEALFRDAVAPWDATLAELDASAWRRMRRAMAEASAWLAVEPPVPGALDGPALAALLDGPGVARLRELHAEDAAAAKRLDAMAELGRLVRLRRDLLTLVRNFVSFADFFAHDKVASFQAGTLLLDGRRFTLCIRILDRAKHEPLAAQARCCLAYCDLVRAGERRTIAVAITNGDSDYLAPGRNGIFYDRQGADWDATVVKVIEHPINIRQAFFAPYKRAIRMVEEMAMKRAAQADGDATAKLVDGGAGTVAAEPKEPKFDLSTIAVIGVVISGIIAGVGAMLQAFFGLGAWMPLGLAGLLLLISTPSMIIAWWKLRSRSLGPILDACGWAVNTRIRITLPLGRSMTQLPQLPAGSTRRLIDPYAEQRTPWKRWAILAIILGCGVWTLWHHHQHQRWWWQADIPAAPAPAVATPAPAAPQ